MATLNDIACMFSSACGGRIYRLAPSSPPAMEALASRFSDINSRLDQLSKNARNARRCEVRRQRVPDAMWRIVTAIFTLSHPSTEPAAWFLATKWRHWDAEKDTCLIRLQTWHANLAATTRFDSILSPETAANQRTLQKARRFLEEWRLHQWVDDANQRIQIAPSSSVMLQQAVCKSSAVEVSSLVTATSDRKSKMQWLRRWRRRWDVNLGTFAARDTLPPALCQKKVLSPTLCGD